MERELPPPESEPSASPRSVRVDAPASSSAAHDGDEEYRVGPGRPPKEYRWRKGHSGNPAGAKPKRSTIVPDLKALLERALNEPVKLRSGQRALITTKAAAGMAKLVAQFADGDRHARRDLIAIANKLGVDLTGGRAGAVSNAVDTIMSANDQAIIDDFLRRHGVEPKPIEADRDGGSQRDLEDDAGGAATENDHVAHDR